MNTWIIDSTNTPRLLKDPWVIDSSATPRQVKKIWVIDSTNTARLVFLREDTLTLITAGAPVGGSNGYVNGAFGSLTPNTLGDGSTVLQLSASLTAPYPLNFVINGYPGVITQSYLTSLTVGAIVLAGSAASFGGGGSGGTASWSWTSGVRFSASTTYTIEVLRS